jgi:hypothetical protein
VKYLFHKKDKKERLNGRDISTEIISVRGLEHKKEKRQAFEKKKKIWTPKRTKERSKADGWRHGTSGRIRKGLQAAAAGHKERQGWESIGRSYPRTFERGRQGKKRE